MRAPLAAMIACSISRDPVVARRTVKTLVIGDSKSKKKKNDSKSNIYGSSLTKLPPAPPKSTSYQEYVGTCKLAARLNALAELQLATVPESAYGWASDISNVVHTTQVMSSELEKCLRPHIPVATRVLVGNAT